MDDLMDEIKGDDDKDDDKHGWIGRMVPITLAIFAVMMAISKTVDDNIVQDIIAQNQNKASLWGLYNETSVKEKLYRIAREQMDVQLTTTQAKQDAAYGEAVKKKMKEFAGEEKKYGERKLGIRGKKEGDKGPDVKKPEGIDLTIEEMDKLLAMENHQDDWFDRSDAAFSVALAFLAMCALLKNKRIYLTSVALGILAIVLMQIGYWLPNLTAK